MRVSVREFIRKQVFPKLLFSDEPVLNAHATTTNGQGVIIFTLELVDLLADDEGAVAALFGHEMAHIVHGDTEAQIGSIIIDLLTNIAGMLLEVTVQSTLGVSGVGNLVADIGGDLTRKAFSREDEREADEDGIKWAIQAGYDPEGSIQFHKKLIANTGDTGGFVA